MEQHEEFVLAERREYYEEKRKLAKMRIDIEERFKRAKVATRINDIIERVEPDREPIQWPQPGSVVPTINAGAGPSDNPQKCGYCGFWDHRCHGSTGPWVWFSVFSGFTPVESG